MSETRKAPVALEYQAIEAAGKRPAWVYGMMGVYGLLLMGVLALPLVMGALMSVWFGFVVFAAVGGILFVGLSLMVIPVAAKLQRPVTKRTIWIPLAGSSLLVAALVFSAILAMDDAYPFLPKDNNEMLVVSLATLIVWAFWVAAFAILTMLGRASRIGDWLYGALLTGNLLELLVAVPMHLVARRRTECCAGYASAMAIGVGAVIAVVAIGPVMFWLYYRRWERVRQK